ncbi:MAG: hypothetical protein HC859_00960 [Bacteroidia bacterium]|nr:hypothetical protein [Bacteroidia bacterium]
MRNKQPMIVIRFFLVLFNVAVVTFLIYRMVMISRQAMKPGRKWLIITAGVLLLLTPFGIFAGVFKPGIQYFLIYPVAIGFFLFLIREP